MFKLIKNYKNEIIEINHMAIPLIMQCISSATIGIVDQAMVGRISITAFGAVGLIASTIYSITGMIGMISIAFNILGSKSKGENNNEEFIKYFNTSLIFCGALGLVFYLITLSFKEAILVSMFGIKETLLVEATKYLSVYSLSLGLTMILFVFSALFKIRKQTKWIFYASVSANIINLVLDYILIFGKLGMPVMGVTGAAIASVISLVAEVVIYIIVLRKSQIFKFKNIDFFAKIKELIRVTIPLSGQEFLESTLLVICFNAILARIGVMELSTYTLINSIINVTLIPMYAYSSTCLTLVGESVGKNDTIKLNIIPKLCLLLTLSFCIIFIVICTTFRTSVPRIITNDVSLILNTSIYIPLVVFIQLFNNAFTIYKSSLQGVNLGYWVFTSSVIINIIGAILVVALVFLFRLNLYGLYIGLGVNYFALFIVNFIKYRTTVKYHLIELAT